MLPFPLNEEDFRIRLEEARRLSDPRVKQEYENIRDAVEQVCAEILESEEKT